MGGLSHRVSTVQLVAFCPSRVQGYQLVLQPLVLWELFGANDDYPVTRKRCWLNRHHQPITKENHFLAFDAPIVDDYQRQDFSKHARAHSSLTNHKPMLYQTSTNHQTNFWCQPTTAVQQHRPTPTLSTHYSSSRCDASTTNWSKQQLHQPATHQSTIQPMSSWG